MDAEQQFEAAAQAYQTGDFPAAEAQLESLARIVPGNPNVLHLLSLARLRQNKADAAVDSLRELADLAPDSAEAHDLLGCALRQTGRVNAAIRHLRRAAEISPEAANIHYNLGNAYRDDRQVGQAMAHFKRATELDPGNLNAFFNLGQTYFNTQDMIRAAEAFYAVVQKAPDDLEAQSLLARSAFLARFYALARKACQDALRLAPGNIDLLALLAESSAQIGEYDEAAATYDSMLAQHPDDTGLMHQKAAVLRAKGDAEGALAMCRKAAETKPDVIDNIAELGRLLERLNRLDEAWSMIGPALDAHPDDPTLALVAARLERRAGDHDKALARLKALDSAALETAPASGDIHFELGFLYERLDRPGDAVENFEKGNAFLARDEKTVAMFRERSAQYLDRLKAAFDGPAAQPSRIEPQAAGSSAPVFLVGFPRSGTTLLDQVMDAHPDIQVLEEQPTLSAVRDRLLVRHAGFPQNLFDIPESELQSLRELYFQAVDRLIERRPGSRLIDKMPLNILDAGLIHRLFPDAKFILALRHPCDVCLSCFMQPFELNEGMVHFTRLDETVRFYDEVMSLWQVQRDALDLNVHEVRYEDLVTGLEPVARDLLEFLDVPWDDRVLDPTGHARAQGFIGTNSYHQVVQDLNTKAVDRWRKYEIHMAPHLGRLRPHLAAFGYGDGGR
jgi:tetratricopeptide (TPR) repeat protein